MMARIVTARVDPMISTMATCYSDLFVLSASGVFLVKLLTICEQHGTLALTLELATEEVVLRVSNKLRKPYRWATTAPLKEEDVCLIERGQGVEY